MTNSTIVTHNASGNSFSAPLKTPSPATEPPSSFADALALFQHVLPNMPEGDTGWLSIHYSREGKDPNPRFSEVAKSPEELAEKLARIMARRDTRNVFFCTSATAASKGKIANRGASNFFSSGALRIDVDVKAGSYADTKSALEAVLAFIIAARIPGPTALVSSGTGGLHVYWRLDHDLPLSDWEPLAQALAAAAREHGLKIDAGCTTDAVRILRVPGTMNWKGGTPHPVALLSPPKPYIPWDAMRQALEPYTRKGAMTAKAKGNPATLDQFTAELLGGIQKTGAALRNIDQVASVCAFVWDTLDTAGRDWSNPLWFLSLAIASFCEDPEATAHRLSSGHPGYHPDETAQEIARCLNNRQTKPNVGFPSCRAIDQAGAPQCKGCPLFALGKSPLSVPGASPLGATTMASLTAGGPLKGSGRYHLAFNTLQASGMKFAHDVFHDRLLVDGKELSDDMCGELRNYIINAGSEGKDPGKDNVYEAARALCIIGKFDPVADYLNSLEWDGVPRLDTWLTDYAGVEDTPLNRTIGRKFLLGMVRRVFWPGCKFDTALILEGPQGAGKSEAVKILAGGDENFLDHDPTHLTGKEQQELIRGRWVIELGELSGMRRGDVNQIKAFMSRTNDRGRPAYGRTVVDQPRRCVFIGTTNDQEYFKDDTGNRRFWPVKIGKIDLRTLANDRDVLFAEAVAIAKSGEDAVLPQALWGDAAEVQEARRERDPWEDLLEGLIEGQAVEPITHNGNSKIFIASGKILGVILNIPAAQQRGEQGKRARRAMERLGWVYIESVRVGGKKKRGYIRDPI